MNLLKICFRHCFPPITSQHPAPEEQHTQDDERTPLLPTNPMKYPLGSARQGQLQHELEANNAASAASSVAEVRTSANSSAPALPIDIDALLAKVVPYRNTLDNLRKENIHPAEFLAKTGERFIPCIIAMENARAKEDARKLKNPALATDLSYYDDTRDLLQYVHELHAKHAPGSPEHTVHGIVQGDATKVSHTFYCDVRIDEKSATNVGIESAYEKAGKKLLAHLNQKSADFPGVKNVVIATDIHKSAAGCPTFATTTGMKVAREPGGVPKVHARMKQLTDGEPLEAMLDKKGDILDWTVYLPAQSQKQAKAVANNPRFPNLATAVLPKNKNKAEPRASGETFLQHHQNRRVTQKVEMTETKEVLTKEFSNAIDRKRIKYLDRLIRHLENLKKTYGDQAGQVFADQLAKVRPARDPSWDVCLPKTRELFGSAWDAAEGLKLFQVEKQQWDKQTPEKKKEILQELMEGLPTWSTPSLQAHALAIIDGGLAEDFGRASQLDSAESLALLNALPALVLPGLQALALDMIDDMAPSLEGIAALLDKMPDMATPTLQERLLGIVGNWRRSIAESPDEIAAAMAPVRDLLARFIGESGDDSVVEALIRLNGAGIVHLPQEEAIRRMKEMAAFLGDLKTAGPQYVLVYTLTESLLDKAEDSPDSEPAYGAILLELTKSLANLNGGHLKRMAEKLLGTACELFNTESIPEHECRQQIMQALERGIARLSEEDQGALPEELTRLRDEVAAWMEQVSLQG